MTKISQIKENIISLSNRTIPVQFDRIVILTSNRKYNKALEEITFIKSQISVLENQLKEIQSLDKESD
jgi:transcription elongation GreA/GreB family factor